MKEFLPQFARVFRAGTNRPALAELLASICCLDRDLVLANPWIVPVIDVQLINNTGGSGMEGRAALFPGEPRAGPVSGERLIERAALLLAVEELWCLRARCAGSEITLEEGATIDPGPPRFQASNVNLEIRIWNDEIALVSDFPGLLRYLEWDGFSVEPQADRNSP